MTDSQFNIKIKEYRAISEADIDLNGITVLSGVNGCGKSSISMLTYEFFKSSINIEVLMQNEVFQLFIEPLILIEDFIKAALEVFNNNRSIKELKTDIANFYNKWNNNSITISELKIELSTIIISTREFYINNEEIINKNPELKQKSSRTYKLISNYLPYNYLDVDFDGTFRNLNQYILNKLEELEVSENSFPSLILTERIKSIYESSSIPKNFEIKEYGELLYSLTNYNEAMKIQSIKEVFYIDSPLILEADDDSLSNNNHWKHLREKIKKSSKHNFNIEIEDLFHKNLGIENIEHIVTFEESFSYIRTDGEKFNLFESATGIKSFAIIQLLYQNGLLTKNTLLLLDEPEIHLHPQWVVEYARLVVLLNKHLGVKFLIASHHPEFVSSIKYISEKEETTKGLNFYIAKEQKKFSYKFVSTGTEIEETFDSFNKSFDLIGKYGDNEI